MGEHPLFLCNLERCINRLSLDLEIAAHGETNQFIQTELQRVTQDILSVFIESAAEIV